MKTVFFVLALLAAGCTSMDSAITGTGSMPDKDRRVALAEQFNLSAEQKQKFVNGDPWIGMSEAELQALMGGKPKKEQRKLTSEGDQTIQIYATRIGDWKTGVQTKFYKAKISAGKLTEFQELDQYSGNLDKL